MLRKLPVCARLAVAGLLLACVPATLAAQEAQVATQPASAPAEPAAAEPTNWLLMGALDQVGVGKPMRDLGLSAWGFNETSFTGRLTNGQDPLFGRVFDATRPNELQPNQTRLTLERKYDATKSFDVAGRFDLLYGSDARVTKNSFAGANDFAFPENVGSGDGANWLDFVQMYAQVWLKTGSSSGLETTVGKFVTPMGAEVIDAIGNPLYSHSYLFGYAIPFTHTGVKLNYVWSPQFSTYIAVVNGWDTFEDNNDTPSYMAGASWSGSEQLDGHARDLIALNVITGPEQTDDTANNRTVVDAVITHWWMSKMSSTLNGDWGHEQKVPGVGGTSWYGVAHYLTYKFNDCVSATWRAEWFADDGGSRIGVPGNYYENTLGLTLTPWATHPVLKNLSLRPELRWDTSDEAVFGDDHNQMTAAMDVIFRF